MNTVFKKILGDPQARTVKAFAQAGGGYQRLER